MLAAIKLAEEKMDLNEGGPFAALIVKNGVIIARGWNRVTAANDPTAHAEMIAIRQACQAVQSFKLEGCEIYVNCEPCPMCLAALYWAGIDKIYYAATRKDAAEIGFADEHIYEEIVRPPQKRTLPMQQILRENTLPVFISWQNKEDKILY